MSQVDEGEEFSMSILHSF